MTIGMKKVDATLSNHRCCAERRLLEAWRRRARQHGVRRHQVVTWIRRKVGANICVWRERVDRSLGCATPCVLCCREMLRYDLRVHCSLQSSGHDAWYTGKLDSTDAPRSKPTLGQRMHMHMHMHMRMRGVQD